jgi:hypothetical protein
LPENKPIDWLLIFDNVENMTTLEPYWPIGANGSIIITTRYPEVASHYGNVSERIEVPPFPPKDGQEFLLKFVDDTENQIRTPKEIAAASQISKAVGNLALGLCFIGSYVHSRRVSLARFLEAHPDFERNFIFDDEQTVQQSYERSISTTWTYNLASATPKDRLLLEMLSLLDGDGIPLSLFFAKRRQDL